MARTLRKSVSLSGVGLFTGVPATVTLEPAEPGSGIAFMLGGERVRATIANLASKPLIPAFARFPARHTCIASGAGRTLATIEHVMSALAGLGITDATVTCHDGQGQDRPEVPILDGSADAFVREIGSVGVEDSRVEGEGSRRPSGPIRVERDEASIVITPRAPGAGRTGPTYRYNLAYPAPIGMQAASWDGDPAAYATEVAPARTFSLEHEARMMQSMGLFGHLTTRDMLVIGAAGPIENEVRFPDEPARHKLLDLIGDMALAGPSLWGLQADIVATRSGHALAHEAARALVAAVG